MNFYGIINSYWVIRRSSTETVEGSALSLEGVNDIESSNSLSLGVLGVGNGVLDNVLEEASEDNSGLVIDEGADSLDSTSSSESSNGWLGDTENGVLDGFGSESLGSSLSSDLSEFTSLGFGWWHCFN